MPLEKETYFSLVTDSETNLKNLFRLPFEIENKWSGH